MKKITLMLLSLATIFSNYSHANPDTKSMAILDQLTKLDKKELDKIFLDANKLEILASKALGIPIKLKSESIAHHLNDVEPLRYSDGSLKSTFFLTKELNSELGVFRNTAYPRLGKKFDLNAISCSLKQIAALKNLDSNTIAQIKELGLPLVINAETFFNTHKYADFKKLKEISDLQVAKGAKLNGPRYTASLGYEYEISGFLRKTEKVIIPGELIIPNQISYNRSTPSQARLEIQMPVSQEACAILSENINHEFQKILPEVAKEKAIDDAEALDARRKEEERLRKQKEEKDRTDYLKKLIDEETSSANSAR